jgi:hypothetical protein
MSYLHCPRCGLSVRLRAPFLTLDCCPRCLARRGTIVSMRLSEHRSRPAATEDAASVESCPGDGLDERDFGRGR